MRKFCFCLAFQHVFSSHVEGDDGTVVQLLQTKVVRTNNSGYDLTTSKGQTECLNTLSSGWSSWDCGAANGQLSVTQKYCDSGEWYSEAVASCCTGKFSCNACHDLSTSEGQSFCLSHHSAGLHLYDCGGTNGRYPAAGNLNTGSLCATTNKDYRKAIDNCCPGYCCDGETGCCGDYCQGGSKEGQYPDGIFAINGGGGNGCGGNGGGGNGGGGNGGAGNGGNGGSVTTTTTIPGGTTNPGGSDCFNAEAKWGPDFDCDEKTDMFCGHDSADGLDLALCCQEHCGTKQEKRSKKQEAEGARKETEANQKSAQKESKEKRKAAEVERKKKNKETEWLNKRSEQEKKNKNSEDERKNKRGFTETKKKNERTWKNGRESDKKKAERRENKRKADRKEAEKKKKRKNQKAKSKERKSKKQATEKRKKKNRAEKKKKNKN